MTHDEDIKTLLDKLLNRTKDLSQYVMHPLIIQILEGSWDTKKAKKETCTYLQEQYKDRINLEEILIKLHEQNEQLKKENVKLKAQCKEFK